MRDFLILTRVQALGLINSLAPGMQQRANRGRRLRRLLGTGLLALLIALAMGAYLFMTGAGLVALGLARVIPSIAALVGAVAGVAFAFAKTRGVLFALRDFDHVMSLPIARRTVVASRLGALYGSAVVLSVLFAAPLFVAYFTSSPASAWSICCAVVTALFAPLIPVSVAICLAFVLTAAAARFRHANAVFIVLALLLILAVMIVAYGFSFSVQSSDSAATAALLSTVATQVDQTVRGLWLPAAWASDAVTTGSVGALAAFAATSLAVPALALEGIQRSYLSLNSLVAGGGRARRPRGNGHAERTARSLSHNGPAPVGASANATCLAGRTTSPFVALMIKEARTIVGIPAYAINCLFGYLFMVVVAGAIVVVGLQPLLSSGVIDGVELTAEEFDRAITIIMALVPWAFAFCAAMSPTAACSVSLEGRSFWITATAPLPARTILGAKLATNALPVAVLLVVCALACGISGQLSPLAACEIPILGFGVFYLMVNAGFALDVARPNLSWSSPNEVVKRGMPVMVSTLGGLVVIVAGIAGVLGAAYLIGPTASMVLNLVIGVLGTLAGQLIFRHACKRADTTGIAAHYAN